MTKNLVGFLIFFFVMLIIDGIWLSLIARNFYKANLGHVLAEKPDWLAAALFYVIFTAGVSVFVVSPCLENGDTLRAALLGALFGLVTYATYDLTNQATLKDWPKLVTLIDLCWGSALTSFVSFISVFTTSYFFKTGS